MKIINSISSIYNERIPLIEMLKERVDMMIRSHKKETWHFYSRIKSEESFALKLETGRVHDPKNMEDFLGCTVVVENISEIKNAIEFIERYFEIKEKRPLSETYTSKETFSFQFDDLRLYVKLQKIDYMPSDSISDITFEIQIKTFLQHAWSIATHDLIYKTDKVSWSKERVAYQIKAMLEQAEISIAGAEGLSKLPELAKENKSTKLLNEINSFLTETFPYEFLPSDLLRLTRIISEIMKIFKLKISELKKILEEETNLSRGIRTLNLSPYCIIIQSIINQKPTLFESVFNSGDSKIHIFLPSEICLRNVKIHDNSRFIMY